MGNKLLLLLFAATLATAAFFLIGGTDHPEPPATPTLETPGTPESTPRPQKQAPDALEIPEEQESDVARVEVTAKATPDWVTDETEEREGRVSLPAGTPADEELEIAVTNVTDEAWLEHTAKVDPNGRFRFYAPPGEATTTLELQGHYLYLDEPYLAGAGEVVLEPRLGAWISGQLIAPDGADPAALEGSEIKPTIDLAAGFNPVEGQRMGRAFQSTKADSSGAFELGALPTGLAFALAADSKQYPLVTVSDLNLSPGEHRQLAIHLEPGASISGLVVDPDGAPIEDCQLECTAGGQFNLRAQIEKRQARSDAEGRFRIPGLAPGEVHLTARVTGYIQESELTLELSAGEERDGVRVVLSRGNEVAGLVLDEAGVPVASAEVSLRFDPAALNGLNAQNAGVGARGSALTDQDGRFSIGGLGGGPFMVSAELEAEDGTWSYGQVAGIKPGDKDIKLGLRVLPALTGRVINAAGEPVESFHLELKAGNLGGMMAGNAVTRELSDPDGRFSLPRIQEGEWNLYISAKGYGQVGPIDADRPGPGDGELVVELERGVTARGQVVDPSGKPVPGALVTWQADAGDLVLNLIGLSPRITDLTDQDGAFELVGLPAGSITLNAESPDWAAPEPQNFAALPDEVVEGLVLTMRTGGAIKGLFLDQEGEPEAAALIQIQKPGGADQTITSTDAAGEFHAEKLEPGKWQIVAIAADTKSAKDQSELLKSLKMDVVDVVDGETTEVTLGAPPEDPVHVKGRVEPGASVAGGIAIFTPEGKGLLGGMRMATIGEAGQFELDLDKPGSYVVTIQSTPSGGAGQDNVEFQEEIPSEPEVSLVFRLPGGALSGRVTDTKGTPLGAVRVSLYADGGTSTGTLGGGKYTEATTESDGTWRIGHLRPGTYTVGAGGRSIAAVFDSSAGYGRVVRSGLAVGLDEEVSGVDFELSAAGSIEGRVVDSTGAPVPGASLFVRDEDGVLLERISLVTTGSDGSFSYGGVAAGHYTISARSKSEVSPEATACVVRSGETSTVELNLSAGTILEVSVVNGDNKPVSASLEVLDSNGQDVAGQFGMGDLTELLSGDFSLSTQRFGPLPPGKYKVTGTSGGLSGKKPVTLSGQERRRIKLRLK